MGSCLLFLEVGFDDEGNGADDADDDANEGDDADDDANIDKGNGTNADDEEGSSCAFESCFDNVSSASAALAKDASHCSLSDDEDVDDVDDKVGISPLSTTLLLLLVLFSMSLPLRCSLSITLSFLLQESDLVSLFLLRVRQ